MKRVEFKIGDIVERNDGIRFRIPHTSIRVEQAIVDRILDQGNPFLNYNYRIFLKTLDGVDLGPRPETILEIVKKNAPKGPKRIRYEEGLI